MNQFFSLIKTVYAEDVVGTISIPGGIPSEVPKAGEFIGSIIRFLIIIAGLFSLWQFLSGGLGYISSGGDKNKIQEATNKITMSLVGLVIIAGSFIIIALAGQLLFGSFTAFLSPTFTSVTP